MSFHPTTERSRHLVSVMDACADHLAAIDVSPLDHDELRAVTASLRRLESRSAAVGVRVARRCDQLARVGRGAGATDTLLGTGEVSGRRARKEAQRGAVVERMPSLGEALDRGDISAEHLDAVARTAARLEPEEVEAFDRLGDQLAQAARRLPVDTFGREVRGLVDSLRDDGGLTHLQQQRARSTVRTWIDKATGMGHLHAELDPERHALITRALDTQTDSLAASSAEPTQKDHHLRAAAFTELVAGSPGPASLRLRTSGDATPGVGTSGDATPGPLTPGPATPGVGTPGDASTGIAAGSDVGAAADHPNSTRSGDTGRVRGPSRPSIVVVVDAETLLTGRHTGSVCRTNDGTDLPVEVIERYRCDATLRRVIIDERGLPIDVGRSVRTATAAQWAALTAMYTSCAWPGCDRPLSWCQAHHVHEWEQGGPTDLDNLLPLCSEHHHRVHEGRWRLKLFADRTLDVFRPDGRRWKRAPAHTRWRPSGSVTAEQVGNGAGRQRGKGPSTPVGTILARRPPVVTRRE